MSVPQPISNNFWAPYAMTVRAAVESDVVDDLSLQTVCDSALQQVVILHSLNQLTLQTLVDNA